jgi:hypothetical protein
MASTEFVCQCSKRVGCSPLCRQCEAEMRAYLATIQPAVACVMCGQGRAYPPNPYCDVCLEYMAQTEAEVSSER